MNILKMKVNITQQDLVNFRISYFFKHALYIPTYKQTNKQRQSLFHVIYHFVMPEMQP